MNAIELLSRDLVALTFLFSAAWKLRNRADFAVALASALPRIGRRGHLVGPAVGSLEVGIGAGLLALPTWWEFGLAAVLFLIIFSAYLTQADSLANGCGCWRPVRRGRAPAWPYLVRNGLLLLLAAAGSVYRHGLAPGAEVALAAAAVIPAWLVMEIPNVTQLLASTTATQTVNLGGEL